MKLQFKQQRFQADAAKAVVDVFAGQPYGRTSYRIDRNSGDEFPFLTDGQDFAVWGNRQIGPELNDQMILENIRKIQKEHQIKPSDKLEGTYNLTIEMETGVGKTYTYIKTIYELNKHYGWSKFIVVVPNIAIREGVYRSFQVTQEHFAGEYGKKIHFFIYHSAKLTEIDRFASDSSIHVMIINAQAFNARGKEARKIYMKLDEFRSRRPIDLIAKTNPILIIDEPQSVEGKQTRKNLEEFHPLMTLRYSATHKSDGIYNMIYRLDALEAYQKKLVKKIAVKGIVQTGTKAADGYVYLEEIHLSKAAPTAVIQFHNKSRNGIKTVSRKIRIGENLYEKSGKLEEYKNNFIVSSIDGRDHSVGFLNGIRIIAGNMIGKVSEEQFRRVQIRETILSHIERERQLFSRGIKVLSLFFIDEVEHYRKYDSMGNPENGIFAEIFEQEYEDVIRHLQLKKGEEDYIKYLQAISARETHAGYFSVDKKGHMVNSKVRRKETSSDDVDAYDLIMKNQELLLERNPQKSPVRFLFSHSALREGWDNPNVFQICTLKQSGSEIRKRQEVGRGMRLCVNEKGERMDANVLGEDVHQVNVLTVIASESYEAFTRALQSEIARDCGGEQQNEILPENARSSQVELQINQKKLEMPEFQTLWNKINRKTVYTVKFSTEELVKNCIAALDAELKVPKILWKVEQGSVKEIESENKVPFKTEFVKESSEYYGQNLRTGNSNVKYDLIGKLVEDTEMTRKAVVQILTGIQPKVFRQFQENPEEFLIQAAKIINHEKESVMIRKITYELLNERYGLDLLINANIKGKWNENMMETKKHLFDYVVCDSQKERKFAEELEISSEVAVYVKLPKTFFIATPMGHYTPDWAIAFQKGSVKQVFFVAETKGTMEVKELREIERAKIHCAKEHFKAISGGEVRYGVVDSYHALMDRVMK